MMRHRRLLERKIVMAMVSTTRVDARAGGAQAASVIRAGTKYRAEQGSDYEPGVSAETVGSKALFLGIASLPAGGRTRAHVHERHETALYVLSGELELWSGDDLQHRATVHAGDYIYIPANVLHVAVNRTEEPAVCIATRNEPTAQESVVLYPHMDGLVP
jgi:uncharacterized RmlC-like cupin family protein